MMTKLNVPIRITKNDINQATNILIRAFKNDPLYSYIIPDEAKRNAVLHYLFQMRVRYGISYGEVYANSKNVEGIAIWIPSEYINMTSFRVFKCGGFSLLIKAGKDTMTRLSALDEYASAMHKRHANFPHWHLSPIVVDPNFQGKGFARTLLLSKLKQIDKEHLPCFLETQSQVNVSIYEKYGFRVVEEGKIPNSNLMHWAMIRDRR